MRILFSLLFAAGMVAATGVRAAEPAGPSSVDEELLQGLNVPIDPLDAAQGAAPASPAASAGEPAAPSIDDLTDELMQELGSAADSETADPLLKIARRMREAESLLARSDASPPLRDTQEQIVRDLDELIKQARKKCQGGACPKPGAGSRQPSRPKASQPKPPTAGSKPSNKPATQSTPRTSPPKEGPDAETAQADMQEILKRLWGELPDKAREQVLQSPVEDFLPRYELLIEEYFRRLAEDQP